MAAPFANYVNKQRNVIDKRAAALNVIQMTILKGCIAPPTENPFT
jgi:hypothetical protein